MKKLFKKSLAVIMVVVMAMTSAPLAGFKAKAATISSYSVSDIVEFGWYPQSKVTDSDIIAALNDIAGDNSVWTSYEYYSGTGVWLDGKMTPSDYMRYKDVFYGSDKYRGVVFDFGRPDRTDYTCTVDNMQVYNGYTIERVHWFKYEPIRWRVLDPGTGLVVAETVVDAQPYNNYNLESGIDENGYEACWGSSAKTHYANNYAESSIRKWLNDDFYNTAFSAEQQNIIVYTLLDNSAYSSKYSAYDSETTNDKIYLLSYSDALNANYGFSSDIDSSSTRYAYPTDYAKAQGTYAFLSPGTSFWWLRSPSNHSGGAKYVSSSGDISYGSYVNYNYGIRPALNFNLSFDIFQSDVTDTCEHIIGEWETKVEPDCTNEGVSVKKCTVCFAELETQPIEATGHSHEATVTPPTCTKDGYTTHTCSVCNDTYTDSETKATDHRYESEVTKEPTCTNTGIRKFTCHCGDSYTEVIKANGHTKGEWEYIGGKEYAKLCTVCGDKLESKIVTVDIYFNGENINKKQVLNKSTAELTANATDNFVNDFIFASSNKNIVSVDANGNLIANYIGKTIITVTIKGTTIFDTIEIEVLPRDFTIIWNVNGKQTKQTVKEYASFTPNATTTRQGYKFIGWDSKVPSTMPSNNLTFTAQYELLVKELKIKNPSVTTVNYGETLVMHADFGGVELPEGWTIQWTVEGAGFNMAPAEDGLTCKLTSVANGNATVKATLVDENGEAVTDTNGNEMSDSKQLTSKAGFFQKLISFFKNLFGISRIILQAK